MDIPTWATLDMQAYIATHMGNPRGQATWATLMAPHTRTGEDSCFDSQSRVHRTAQAAKPADGQKLMQSRMPASSHGERVAVTELGDAT
mmetsp:Transcript_137088/g.255987  ORF Transcript_137088/g.255987 Transcript_137088/m.255987 type:complete len:89 (-) Transcript_137088:1131-1397(-)